MENRCLRTKQLIACCQPNLSQKQSCGTKQYVRCSPRNNNALGCERPPWRSSIPVDCDFGCCYGVDRCVFHLLRRISVRCGSKRFIQRFQSKFHCRCEGGGSGSGSSSGSEEPVGIPISSLIQRCKSANLQRSEQKGMWAAVAAAVKSRPQVGHFAEKLVFDILRG